MLVAAYLQKKIEGKTTVEIIDMDGHFPQLTAHTNFKTMFMDFLFSFYCGKLSNKRNIEKILAVADSGFYNCVSAL